MLAAGGRQSGSMARTLSTRSSSSSARRRTRCRLSVAASAAYSAPALEAIRAAQREAVRQGRMFVAPPQLLLGLLASPGSAAARLLGAAGVSAELAEAVLVDAQLLPASSSMRPGDLHFAPDAREALSAAAAAAAEAGLPAAGTPHLLLGVLTCGNSDVASVLRRAGVDSADALLEQARAAGGSCDESSAQQAQPASGEDQAAALVQQYRQWTATHGNTPPPDGGVGGQRRPAPTAMVFTPEDDDIYN